MPIEVRCRCGAAYRVPDNTAGRKLRCKHCQELVAIPKEAPVAEVAVEVVEEFAEVEEVSAADTGDRPRRNRERDRNRDEDRDGGGGRKEKKKKKKRRDPADNTLEGRLARREQDSWRKNEIRRGWKYFISGLGLIALGVMLTVSMHIIAVGDPQNITRDYGLVSLAYRVAGIWGPLIGFGIAGLVPCGIGILNFMGIAVVVEEPDD